MRAAALLLLHQPCASFAPAAHVCHGAFQPGCRRDAAPMQSSLSIRHYNKAGIYRKRSRFAPRLAMPPPRLKTAWLEEVLFEIPLWGADKCQVS